MDGCVSYHFWPSWDCIPWELGCVRRGSSYVDRMAVLGSRGGVAGEGWWLGWDKEIARSESQPWGPTFLKVQE